MHTSKRPLALYLLLLGILAACVPVRRVTDPANQVPTVAVGLVEAPTATLTPAPTETPVPATEPSPTPTSEPPTPWPELSIIGNPYLPPVDLCAVQHVGPGPDPVNVRLGPGADFAVVAWLGVERWAEATESRNGWYQIRTGPGEVGWVDGKEVTVSGLCTASTPMPTPTASGEVPLILDPGAPPSNVCVASLAPDVPPIDVYLGPGMQYAIIARLRNWAEVLKSSGYWRMIWIVPGNVGWVQEEQVVLSEPCTAAPGP
jgi:SH3-like domain-containing protein